MKNKMKIWISAAMLAVISFTACKKDGSNAVTPSDNGQSQEISVMVNQADQSFADPALYGGSESEEFYFDNDGLPDAYLIAESDLDGLTGVKREISPRRIIGCLAKLELTDTQIVQLRRVFKDYEGCKLSVVNRYNNAIAELIKKANASREELVKMLRDGKITKEQFEKRMQALRVDLVKQRNAMAEKARQALKECYTTFLRNTNGILTERQWKAFINCYR